MIAGPFDLVSRTIRAFLNLLLFGAVLVVLRADAARPETHGFAWSMQKKIPVIPHVIDGQEMRRNVLSQPFHPFT